MLYVNGEKYANRQNKYILRLRNRKSRTRIHWFVSYMYMIITALTNHNQSISTEMNFKSHSEGEMEGYVQVHLSTQISFVA